MYHLMLDATSRTTAARCGSTIDGENAWRVVCARTLGPGVASRLTTLDATRALEPGGPASN